MYKVLHKERNQLFQENMVSHILIKTSPFGPVLYINKDNL